MQHRLFYNWFCHFLLFELGRALAAGEEKEDLISDQLKFVCVAAPGFGHSQLLINKLMLISVFFGKLK